VSLSIAKRRNDGLILVPLVWVEKIATHPLVPLKDLSPEIILILGAVGAGWSSFGIWICKSSLAANCRCPARTQLLPGSVYLWQSWAVLRGDSPLEATAQMAPICLSGTAAALTAGYLMSRMKPGYILLGSMFAFCAGNVIASVTPPNLTYRAASFIGVLITPFGIDCSFPATNLAASDFMPRHQQGLGASLVNTMTNHSISMGLGLGALVERHLSKGGTQILVGYRGAHYVGISSAFLGMSISCLLIRITRSR
jgi:hypothetical protein